MTSASTATDKEGGINPVLSEEQIQTYLKDGVLVVDNIFTPSQVQAGLKGLAETLARNANVDIHNLEATGHGLQKLSSTNGSGGVLDVAYYDSWKMEIALNPRLFHATTQLWKAAYCHSGESAEELSEQDYYRWHPFGKFDCNKGFCYIDRIGYRLPTKLAEKLGKDLLQQTTMDDVTSSSSAKKKKKKSVAIQRSLTPHLDCCPETFYFEETKSKFRPIQCFVCLTDALEENTGGFEAAPGFHRKFYQWAENRPPTTKLYKKKEQVGGKLVVTEETVSFPAPCLGEYTHIRPTEDRDVMDRIRRIPARAGSVVFFDNRIPHANSYLHNGDNPRCVVYCSFLPDVPLNRDYATRQLAKWKRNDPPNDQWVGYQVASLEKDGSNEQHENQSWLTPLARKLMYIDPW